MKKNIAFLLTLLALLSMLVGCTKQAAVPTAKPPAAPTEEKTVEEKDTEKALGEEQTKEAVELNILWATENNFPGFEDFITEYEEKTGNTVDIQFYPATDYSAIITTKMMAGEGPDIFRTDGINLLGMWPMEWFADLSSEEWIGRLTSGGLANLTWTDGKIYQAPLQPLGPIGVCYNKDTLAAAGVTELPKNWSEFKEACQKLKDAGYIPYNLQLASGNEFGATQMYKTGWMNMYIEMGTDGLAQFIDDYKTNKVKMADNATMKLVLDQILELCDLGFYNEDYLSTTMEMTSQRLGSGECGFTTGGEWVLSGLMEDYPDCNIGVMPLPVGDSQGAIIVSPGVGMAVNANSAKLEAAKEFVAMWCAAEWQNKYAALNPGTPWFSDVTSEGNKLTADTTYWVSENRAFPTFNGAMQIFPEMESRPLMQELLLGSLDAKGYLQALDDAAEVIAVGKGLPGW